MSSVYGKWQYTDEINDLNEWSNIHFYGLEDPVC